MSGGNNLSIDTARAILIPAELYEEGREEEWLRFNGMAPGAGEMAVATSPRDGVVALMCVRTEILEQHGRGVVDVTSPLLDVATGHGLGGRRAKGRDVNILVTDRNVYFAVWDGGLKMAEAMPDNSVDSIVYYMQIVGRRFDLRRFDIHVRGQWAGLVADALRPYHKKVRVV